jgi:hypothetical protein
MRFILALCLLPFSGFAKTITLESSDFLSHQALMAYTDGTVAIVKPLAYGYPLGATSDSQAKENATAACQLVGKKLFDYEYETSARQLKLINYTLQPDGKIGQPWFSMGGYLGTYTISKVMCQ